MPTGSKVIRKRLGTRIANLGQMVILVLMHIALRNNIIADYRREGLPRFGKIAAGS